MKNIYFSICYSLASVCLYANDGQCSLIRTLSKFLQKLCFLNVNQSENKIFFLCFSVLILSHALTLLDTTPPQPWAESEIFQPSQVFASSHGRFWLCVTWEKCWNMYMADNIRSLVSHLTKHFCQDWTSEGPSSI